MLKANNGKMSKTAKEVGIPLSSLYRIKDSAELVKVGESSQLRRENAEQQQLDIWRNVFLLALEHLDVSKLSKASAQQLVTIMAIATDKGLLLSGQPTSRTETRVDVSSARDKLTRMLKAQAIDVTPLEEPTADENLNRAPPPGDKVE